jgi:cyclopropane fatty-acyl-phospholipid synthase-like methyltransferase
MKTPTSPGPITKSYYEKVYYSDVSNLPENYLSRLHFYRIKKILAIHSPAPTDIVVDLGSAWGELCFTMANRFQKMIGVDFSEKVVKFCRNLLNSTNYPRLFFLCADVQCTGIRSNTVDVVTCADLFEHLYPEQFYRTLDECRRMLKPGGKLVVWTPHRGHIIERLKNNNIILKPDLSHVDYKSMEVMKTQLHQRNFSILKSYYSESHIPIFNLLEKILLPFIPLFRRRIAILAEKLPERGPLS